MPLRGRRSGEGESVRSRYLSLGENCASCGRLEKIVINLAMNTEATYTVIIHEVNHEVNVGSFYVEIWSLQFGTGVMRILNQQFFSMADVVSLIERSFVAL